MLREQVFARKCGECGYIQVAKDPLEYKDSKRESWREVKCRRCKSESLDYGHGGYHLVDGKPIRD